MRRRCRQVVAVVAAVVALGLVGAGPAFAHAGDPTLVTVLRGTDLPDGVTAALRTTIADELVVTNPSATPLTVLDTDGAEFLRISGAGVEGNAASPYFHLSTAPPEVRVSVPRDAVAGAPPRWVPLSTASSWSWFDPRMGLGVLRVPVGGRQEATGTEDLATWTIPMRYGAEDAGVDGALVRRPVTGRFETTIDPTPDGMTVVLGQGYVPTLSLQAAPGRAVAVTGRDGGPYLSFGPDGAQVDTASPTYRDDLLGRGRPLDPARTGVIPLPGTSASWLDTRLRFPAEDPPSDAAGAEGPVDVARWEIPVTVDGVPQALTGSIRWLPNGRGAAGSPWLAVALVGGAVLLVGGGAALVLRNRRLAAQPPANDGTASDDTEDQAHDRQPVA